MKTVNTLYHPTATVSLSLLAVQHTETGVAASIMATTPLLVIPLAAYFDRERLRWHDLAGAALAIVGVVECSIYELFEYSLDYVHI